MLQTKIDKIKLVGYCHARAFPNALSTALGKDFLTRMYNWYLKSDKAFIFHLEENHKVIGYVGGLIVDGSLSTGSASAMMQFSFNAALKALLLRPWLLFHPEMISKYRFAFKNVWYRFQPPKKPMEQTKKERTKPHTGLVVIGVDPAYQGQGVGSKLLKIFEDHTYSIGIERMRLSVFASNAQAIRAYERNGWQIKGTKGKSLTMEKTINNA